VEYVTCADNVLAIGIFGIFHGGLELHVKICQKFHSSIFMLLTARYKLMIWIL
jgi:hypothetical protein